MVAICPSLFGTHNSEVSRGTWRHHTSPLTSQHALRRRHLCCCGVLLLLLLSWAASSVQEKSFFYCRIKLLCFVICVLKVPLTESKQENKMAQYKGAASEAGRAMQLMKKREKEREQLEQLKQKIAEVCHLLPQISLFIKLHYWAPCPLLKAVIAPRWSATCSQWRGRRYSVLFTSHFNQIEDNNNMLHCLWSNLLHIQW